ncbi:hypothetical protein [Atopobium deltae]|uniref:Uncharacterized protein n=1 Tax=Atopobium deltae TaxID=1393034 RepID=A0A133XTV6_9ACTN|nr:hypothetical protein [Atopobium deltae]KXB34363.1 hypothetical protein HMPREF3192_00915 [Atopobium deltae]
MKDATNNPASADTLTDAERAELQALRKEKERRLQQQQRAELQALREEQRRQQRERAEDERIAKIRERNRRAMEPDEDLRMPFAQKLVLGTLAFFVVVFIIYYFMH